FAHVFQAGGMARVAEALQSDVLTKTGILLGAEHPDTIRAMANLASTYRDLGQYADAEKLKCVRRVQCVSDRH
ncbi:hypothetical protein C8F01DRAFT_1329376, partial [Mycena amicta]